ncbi:hypothetical protein [Methylomonas methanica]|nr:hypothetical protein [Methylomonas methanica]
MKKRFIRFFEPLWFLLFIIVVAGKWLNPTFRRWWKTNTGCGYLKLCRYISKRTIEIMPFTMPGLLLCGATISGLVSGVFGAIAGAGLLFVLLVTVPFLFPLPSVIMEGQRG